VPPDRVAGLDVRDAGEPLEQQRVPGAAGGEDGSGASGGTGKATYTLGVMINDTTQVDNWVNSTNLSDAQDLLSKYPKGTLQAIIAQGPEMYVGAAYAVKVHRTDVKFIAGDYSTQVEAAIKAGQLYGTVNQSPITEGTDAAQDAYYWLTGKKSLVETPDAYVPLPIVTAANVAKYQAAWSG
jgi:ABC-type sugar transport system substrate-binding protein